METLNLELVKTVKYKLEPFGKFYFKWSKGRDIPHLIADSTKINCRC